MLINKKYIKILLINKISTVETHQNVDQQKKTQKIVDQQNFDLKFC